MPHSTTKPSTLRNILYLDSGQGIGGGQRSLLLLLKHLDKTRFRPLIGCIRSSMLATEARKAGHCTIALDLPSQHDKQDKNRRFTSADLVGDLRQFRVILQLLQVVKAQRVDLIHANSLATGLVGGVVAKSCGIPIVMHKRYATSYGVLDRICEKLLDAVILVSEATRWNFAAHAKQMLIYNGVELSSFHSSAQQKEAVRADLNLNPDAICVGVVTRITPEKGVHLLVEAMSQLKALPLVNLLIVGGPYFPSDAAYIESLKATALKSGISDRVIFTGFLADTRAIISTLDVVLLASTIPEACPRTIIEAMAAGKPTIATPLGGTKELITPDTGILVSPDDPTAFAQAITQLAEDGALRNRMGEAARSRAECMFSAEQNTRSTEALYLRLLA